MKKFLFLIILIVGLVNFRNHPAIEPYISNILNIASEQAKNAAGVVEAPKVFSKLDELETLISDHEFRYIKVNIQNLKQVDSFDRKQCHDTSLSHTVLTEYSIKKVCGILKVYR